MKTKLQQQLFALTLAAVSLQGVSAHADIIMTEQTSLVRPTKFRLNEPVANVSEITYKPLHFSKYKSHVLDLTDRTGKVIAIAEEYKFSWRDSIIQLKKINGKNEEELVATLTESTDPDNKHATRFSVANRQGVPVAIGNSNLIDNEVISYEFRHGGKHEGEARHNTASDKVNEWTIDVRDESVVHPLLIASLITFKRATHYRWSIDIPVAGVVTGMALGTYLYRHQLSMMVPGRKGGGNKLNTQTNTTQGSILPHASSVPGTLPSRNNNAETRPTENVSKRSHVAVPAGQTLGTTNLQMGTTKIDIETTETTDVKFAVDDADPNLNEDVPSAENDLD